LVEVTKTKSEIPAALEIWDIAGLVKGAAEGAGLGNAFLSNISAVDGIYHVCRAFESTDVVHVEDRVDPVEDLAIIGAELRAKDIERCEKQFESLSKLVGRGQTKEQKEAQAACEAALACLKSGKDIRLKKDWTTKEVEWLNETMLLTAKPVVYLVNVSQKDFLRKRNKWLPKLHAWIQENSGGEPMIPFSGELEGQIVDMPEDEAKALFSAAAKEGEAPMTSVLPKIIRTGFTSLHLIYYFTAGEKEVRCWTIPKGFKAPQAAGAIHGDFERGFICAEVMAYDVLRELGSENAVKAAGKYRQEGKNYVVQDGDVIFFKFNVTAPGKK